MKSVFALAALAAIGFAGAAYAGDVAPKVMSDSEMDKVTAGQPGFGPRLGVDTAVDASPAQARGNPKPPGGKGLGVNTEPGSPH
jgi:hypothetical protein